MSVESKFFASNADNIRQFLGYVAGLTKRVTGLDNLPPVNFVDDKDNPTTKVYFHASPTILGPAIDQILVPFSSVQLRREKIANEHPTFSPDNVMLTAIMMSMLDQYLNTGQITYPQEGEVVRQLFEDLLGDKH